MKTTKYSQMVGGTAGDKKPSDKRNFVVPNGMNQMLTACTYFELPDLLRGFLM
jgi:hypothetical protein